MSKLVDFRRYAKVGWILDVFYQFSSQIWSFSAFLDPFPSQI